MKSSPRRQFLFQAIRLSQVHDSGGEPKRLVTFDCRHYDVYMDLQDAAAEAALGWYRAHL